MTWAEGGKLSIFYKKQQKKPEIQRSFLSQEKAKEGVSWNFIIRHQKKSESLLLTHLPALSSGNEVFQTTNQTVRRHIEIGFPISSFHLGPK